MFETDADRLALIKSLGGQLVRHPDGQFAAIFDNGFSDASVGDIDIEGTQPMLTARTIDVETIAKDTPLDVTDERGRVTNWKFEKHEPDGTGISRVILSL